MPPIWGIRRSVSQPPALARPPWLSPHAVLVLIRSNSVFAGGSCVSLGRVRGARSCDKGRKGCEANARAQPVTVQSSFYPYLLYIHFLYLILLLYQFML